MNNHKKIAIVHEMLVKIGGAEKVVETIMKEYPNVDIFTLMYDEKQVGNIFPKEKIHPQVFSLPSQRRYKLTGKQRLSLPLLPRSIEQLDLSIYDVVIVSSSGFAHGIITKPETKTIIYYHAPARYLWDWTNEYKRDIGMDKGIKSYFYNKLLLKLRMRDFIASNRHDITLANSKNTAGRIKKYYKKEAQILYPPIETQRFQKILTVDFPKIYDEYYIIISALTEFKRLDIAVRAFNDMPDKNLVIIGKGELREKLESLIKHNNMKLAGPKYGDELVHIVQNSMGLVFPGEEDFGMVPIEALAAGKPVFALGKGGLTESVMPGKNGEFFYDPDGKDFLQQFEIFHANNLAQQYSEDYCRQSAQKFSVKAFTSNLDQIIHSK